jgi:hypothetical protein
MLLVCTIWCQYWRWDIKYACRKFIIARFVIITKFGKIDCSLVVLCGLVERVGGDKDSHKSVCFSMSIGQDVSLHGVDKFACGHLPVVAVMIRSPPVTQ